MLGMIDCAMCCLIGKLFSNLLTNISSLIDRSRLLYSFHLANTELASIETMSFCD